MEKKLQIVKIALLVVIAGVAVYTIYKTVSPSVKPSNQDKPENKDYTPESFPLKKGMYGEKTRKVRAVMGLTPSDVFDKDLENTLYSKFGVKEVKESDYNYWAKYVTPNV